MARVTPQAQDYLETVGASAVASDQGALVVEFGPKEGHDAVAPDEAAWRGIVTIDPCRVLECDPEPEGGYFANAQAERRKEWRRHIGGLILLGNWATPREPTLRASATPDRPETSSAAHHRGIRLLPPRVRADA